ncbi:hypothetical protein G6F32_015967 [Rhizopus arrhizus]|nr:hypothetical protein G6F32_015967 [Rhizopus arrhizus]
MGFIDGVGDRCQACNGDGGDCAKGAGDIWPEAVRLLRVFAQDLAGCNADAKQAAELLAGIDAAPTPVADSLERDYRARKWPPAPGVYQVERTLEQSAQPAAQLKGERDA